MYEFLQPGDSVMTKLFTFILDFRGGTYISQHTGFDVRSALRTWARDLDVSGIKYFGPAVKQALIEEMESEESQPVALAGLSNVWFTDALVRTGHAMINIVQTAP